MATITHGQRLRGHGSKGWPEAGWDNKNLQPELRELLMHYGQLSEATYDHLGMDPCQPTWGYNTVPASQQLDYLTRDYPLDLSAKITGDTPKGTRDIYHIPKSGDLSPLIFACPGGDPATAAAKAAASKESLVDRIFETIAGVPVDFIGGSRPLFAPIPATGRDIVTRSAFMGYVAVSQPTGSDKEVDVSFVWRGTIFKEEWAANFVQDKLVKWEPPNYTDSNTARPWDIGVHDGFQDLYLRPAIQPDPLAPEAVPAKLGNTELAPRQVVHMWMKELMRDHNVTTITTTGHSLGAALSTLSAFDIAQVVDQLWADNKEAKAERDGWTTKARPTVTAIAFAPPRVGNFKFARTFSDDLKAKELRICNVGDVVPQIPGLWGQLVTSILAKFGIKVYVDMDSLPSRLYGWALEITGLLFGTWLFGSRWGYMHVGTILEVESDKDLGDVGKTDTIGRHHNLEVYLYLLSKKGTTTTDRNTLLMNKGDDILNNKKIPANWWRFPKVRGFKLNQQGRWEH